MYSRNSEMERTIAQISSEWDLSLVCLGKDKNCRRKAVNPEIIILYALDWIETDAVLGVLSHHASFTKKAHLFGKRFYSIGEYSCLCMPIYRLAASFYYIVSLDFIKRNPYFPASSSKAALVASSQPAIELMQSVRIVNRGFTVSCSNKAMTCFTEVSTQ